MTQPHAAPIPSTDGRLPAVTPADRRRLLTDLLKGVSRAFYRTLRVLPKDLREPVGLAYLLARAADTIADTRVLPPEQRLQRLLAFRAQVQGGAATSALQEIGLPPSGALSSPGDKALLESLPLAFSMLEALPGNDRALVQSIVVTLTHGMEMDLTSFPAEDSGQVRALRDWEELDHYTYCVAGCVGEFWTAITMAHTKPLRRWDGDAMSRLGVRFGKALQMTNVLRDVPKDLRIGRCYLPESELRRSGLTAADLLRPAHAKEARRALINGIEMTLGHLDAAEQYLLAIPRRCIRLRLAVLWPILIGLGTLADLARNPSWLDPERPSKVSRRWIYRMMALSIVCVASNMALRLWISYLRRQVRRALE